LPYAGLLVLSISVFIAGCMDIVRVDTGTNATEVAALFEQPYIDPLTRFLDDHRKDSSRVDDVSRVRQERYRRCGEVAARYLSVDATSSALNKLEHGYRYSCPQVVDAFAARVNAAGTSRQAEANSAVESEAGGSKLAVASAASKTGRIDTAAAENCYLLFGIKNYRDAQAACGPPAEQGDARSQYGLGVIFGTLNDTATALKWIRLACAQGLPEAQLQLGLMYQTGQGVGRDEREALQWFLRAGEQGLAESQYQAGMSYYQAKGTGQDYSEARQWFGRAAEQGYAQAQARLGEMYARGEGVQVDGEHAESWLKRAAEQGVVDAQYRLGLLYDEGNIVPRDETQAYVWLSVAALAGNHEAEVRRDGVAQSLDPERIEQSQQRIRRIVEQRR